MTVHIMEKLTFVLKIYKTIIILREKLKCLLHKNFPCSPDWRGWVGWALPHKVKLLVKAQPGLQVWSPVRARTRSNTSVVLADISVSLLFSSSFPRA